MYWRAPDYNAVRYFFCTIMALVVGGVFFGLGRLRGTQQQVFNGECFGRAQTRTELAVEFLVLYCRVCGQ